MFIINRKFVLKTDIIKKLINSSKIHNKHVDYVKL